MRRQRRGVQLFCLLFTFVLFAAACSSDKKSTGTGSSSGAAGAVTTQTKADPCTFRTDKAGQPIDRIVVAGEQKPTGLNFQASEDNAAWTQYLMQGVWPFVSPSLPDGTSCLNTDLVTKFTVKSTNPLVIDYEQNPKAVWSDGVKIGIDDWKFTWVSENGKEVLPGQTGSDGKPVPKYQAAATNGYESIKSVEQAGDNVIEVTFDTPYADYLGLWAPILPAHAMKAAGGGDDGVGFNTGYKIDKVDLANLPSGGVMKVSKIDHANNDAVLLEANDKYWGDNKAPAKQVVFNWIEDATQQPAALQNGEADTAFPQAQIDLLQQVQALTGFDTQVGFGTFWEHIDFNQSNELLADVNVRKAFATGLDRQAIVDTVLKPFSADAKVLNNRIFFPQDTRFKDTSGGKYDKPNVAAATALLEGAGYTKGSDGVYAKNGKRLSFKIAYLSTNDRRAKSVELIRDQLKAIGIEIQADPRPNHSFLSKGEFEIALFGWTGGTTLGSDKSIYITGGGQNFTQNKDSKIDDLLNQADVELNDAKRADLYNQVDQLAWDDMMTLPIAQNPEIVVFSKKLQGIQYNGYQGYAWDIGRWGKATS